jgi:AcrR family transcriptional regulator
VANDTRTQIRSVALELFASQGYEQTSLREIADRVGITKASLYYHYPSKQALLGAVVEPLLEDWRHVVHEAEALPRTPGNIERMLGEFLTTMLDHRPVAALLKVDMSAVIVALAPILAEVTQLTVRLQRWLAGPDASGPERIRAQLAIEALGLALSSPKLLPDVTEEELRSTLLGAANAVLAGS